MNFAISDCCRVPHISILRCGHRAKRDRFLFPTNLGGIATNMGVESTARAAHDQGYELIFAEDGMSTMSPEFHAFPIKNIFPRMGRVRTTDQILSALK